MTIGVTISLISLALSILGIIATFSYKQGRNENRLATLEDKLKKVDEIDNQKITLEKILVKLDYIEQQIKEIKEERENR